MVIYTLVPEEMLVLSEKSPQIKEVQLGSATLILEETENGKAKILRLISSNIQDYLNPDYQPGTIIEYAPVISSQQQ